MSFLSNRQPEEFEISPHRLRPQYLYVRRFQSKSKTKIYQSKIAIFPRRGAGKNLQNPENLIMGFLSKRQPEECETSPHQLRPQYDSVRRFQTKSKTENF